MKKRQLPEPGPSFFRIPPFNRSAAENETAEDLIDRYLDSVFTALTGEASAEVLAERRLEMKAHIEELADAHAKHFGRLAAVESALRQLGRPKAITRAWRHELKSNQEPLPRHMRLIEITIFAVAGCIWPVLGGLYPEQIRPLLFWLPLMAGLVFGLLAYSRPVVRTLYTQAALSMPMLAINFSVLIWPKLIQEAQDQGLQGLSFSGAIATLTNSLTIQGTVLLLLVVGIWWIGTACLGAVIGERLHRRFLHRHLLVK